MRCLSHQLSSSSRGAFQRPAGPSRCCAVPVRAGAVRAPLREDKRKFYEANANVSVLSLAGISVARKMNGVAHAQRPPTATHPRHPEPTSHDPPPTHHAHM